MDRISVVVPVFNELKCMPAFFERMDRVAKTLRDAELELVFVDDGSTDGSYEKLAEAARHDRRVRVLKFSRNFGSYMALNVGLAHASGDVAVTLSADLQDPPELIPEMLQKWREGFDVVWAARRSRTKDPLWRQWSSRLFYVVFRRIAFSNYPPKGYDFCMIGRPVIDAVARHVERNSSIFALIVWANFNSTAIPYDRGAREIGESHWNLKKMIRLAVDSIISFSPAPVRFSLWCAVLGAVGLLCYFAFIFFAKITGAYHFPPGWPSLMAVILFSSVLQLFILAILGEYLWRTLDESRGRPAYVISRKLGFPESEKR